MSYLSSFTKEKLQEMLAEAQDAYHKLLTGKTAIKVSRAGRAVEYSNANKSDLLNYINDLDNAIKGNTDGRRAGKVWF